MIDLFWSPRINAKNYRELIDLGAWKNSRARSDRPVPASSPPAITETSSGPALRSAISGLRATIIAQEFKTRSSIRSLTACASNPVTRWRSAKVRLCASTRRFDGRGPWRFWSTSPSIRASRRVAIDCFGMKMPVTFAHAWLHRRTGLPIVPVHQEPLPGGRCRVVFHPKLEIPPEATDQEIAQLCWDQFEPVVQAKSRGLALDVQVLALSAYACGPALSRSTRTRCRASIMLAAVGGRAHQANRRLYRAIRHAAK